MFRTDHKVVYEKTTDATDATPDAKDLGDIVACGDTHHPLSKGGRDVYSDDDVDRALWSLLRLTFAFCLPKDFRLQ